MNLIKDKFCFINISCEGEKLHDRFHFPTNMSN